MRANRMAIEKDRAKAARNTPSRAESARSAGPVADTVDVDAVDVDAVDARTLNPHEHETPDVLPFARGVSAASNDLHSAPVDAIEADAHELEDVAADAGGVTGETGLAALKAGGQDACQAFVVAQYEALFRWFVWLAHDHERAADLTQDTFTGFWQSLSRKVPDVTPRAWLYAIGRNLWRKACRSRRVRAKEEEGQALLEQMSGSERNPAATAQDHEWAAALRAEVEQLPDDFREVLCLRLWKDFEYEEIAAVQGISRDLARWRFFRARQLLQGKLKTWQLEEE